MLWSLILFLPQTDVHQVQVYVRGIQLGVPDLTLQLG